MASRQKTADRAQKRPKWLKWRKSTQSDSQWTAKFGGLEGQGVK